MQLPPDVRACFFWPRNRRPWQWRENRPLVEEEDDGDRERVEAASERVRLAAVAERATQSAAEGPALPVPSEAEGSEAERPPSAPSGCACTYDIQILSPARGRRKSLMDLMSTSLSTWVRAC